ncbi:MAG: MlaD family protein [Gammaproteobacteria bacterium]|nr:MlaD family protein [Gammaproteobacteria bacterium]
MKQDNINYTVVGGFVVSISVVLLVVLYFLTGRVANSDRYYTVLENVAGINNGSAITYKGYKVGQLVDIRPVFENNSTRFELTLSVKGGWKITRGSSIMVTKSGLLSDAQLNISEGRSAEVLPANSFLQGMPGDDVMTSFKAIAEKINNISSEVITPMANQLKNNMQLFSETMSSDIPKLTANINLLVVKLQKNSEVIDAFFNETNQKNISSVIVRADSMISNLESVSAEINKLVYMNKSQVDSSIKGINTTAALLNQKLESILNQIESSSQNINDFSNQIKNNPGIIIRSNPLTDPALR